MDLDTADVEDLIDALADRYRRNGITRAQAKLYTVEMLASAFDELEEFEDMTRPDALNIFEIWRIMSPRKAVN